MQKAVLVLKQLLSEFPEIAPELLSLLQTLDQGETAVLSGIGNERIKSLLSTLLPLMGLIQVRPSLQFCITMSILMLRMICDSCAIRKRRSLHVVGEKPEAPYSR